MASNIHPVEGRRTLKWYWVHDRVNFERLARYAHDIPDTSGKQGVQWRKTFKHRTLPVRGLQWDALVYWLTNDLQDDPSQALAILKVKGRPPPTYPASTPIPRAGPTG